jgi:hypothetical protein
MVMLHDDDDNDTELPKQRRTVEEGDETEVNEGKQRTRPIIYEEAMHLLQHRFQS